MKKKRIIIILALVALFAIITVGAVTAGDDGPITRRNVSKTPDTETEKAAISLMSFYVPAQNSDGTVEAINYYSFYETDEPTDEDLLFSRNYAKPLIYSYIDGIEEEHEDGEMSIQSGLGMGSRDTFVALSLNDGLNWKRANVSNAAHLSSFDLADGTEYPGDSFTAVHAVSGDRVMAAWLSRYCTGGNPAYGMDPEEDSNDDGILDSGEDLNGNGEWDLYQDLFGVAGSQKSIDYTSQGFPEVGELPYGCVWTARGQLLPKNPEAPEEGYDIIWTKAERLTSGVRDANRLEIAAAEFAGFAITWQEDPQGLRPGQGLGPGEGWSGAIVNAKTDVWYSFIAWDDFVKVCDPENEEDCVLDIDDTNGAITTLREFNREAVSREVDSIEDNELSAPKPLFPMEMPVRLTDNNICQIKVNTSSGEGDAFSPYCFTDFPDFSVDPVGTLPIVLDPNDPLTDPADMDFCVDTIEWTPVPGDGSTKEPETKEVCVTNNNRVLIGRVGASRPRIAMHGYDSSRDGINDSAWVIIGYEETKAMGEGASEDATEIDVGKNMWYHSFEFDTPDYVSHGNILNQPAMDPLSFNPELANEENFYPLRNSAEIIDLSNEGEEGEVNDYNYGFYETEITRRFSLISQPASKAGESGLVAYALVKQGMINQGGPADIFGQRFVIPAGFDPAEDNPYAFENMACDNWNFHPAAVVNEGLGITQEYNPYYPGGICLDTPTNLSAVEAVTCIRDVEDGEGGSVATNGEDCPTITEMYNDTTDDEVDNPEWILSMFVKVDQWVQCGPGAVATSSVENLEVLCQTDTTDPADDINSLDNQSWENPFDIAKGHRGFLDGDFLMVMYAWSPNYKANKVGKDHYNLYARRSFNGGLSWTTTPGDMRVLDPVVEGVEGDYDQLTDPVCIIENYLNKNLGAESDGAVDYCYDAGVFEQARNVSQLTGTRETILDPRYSPTAASVTRCIDPEEGLVDCTDNSPLLPGDVDGEVLPYSDDATHVDSNFFIVYETGDNTTVELGEATPLDLFYSRATSYGDLYEDVTYTPSCSGGTCPDTVTGWDALENNEPESGEASIRANPAGTFFYAGWNQATEIGEEEFTDMDAYFRRVFYNDDILWINPGINLGESDQAPIATILYVSSTRPQYGDELLIVGDAWDNDHIGGLPLDDIAEVVWTDTFNGVEIVIDDGDDDPKRLNYPVKNLQPGWHQMGFKASDKGGKWSPGVTVGIMVYETRYDVMLPAVVNP